MGINDIQTLWMYVGGDIQLDLCDKMTLWDTLDSMGVLDIWDNINIVETCDAMTQWDICANCLMITKECMALTQGMYNIWDVVKHCTYEKGKVKTITYRN